MFFERFSKKLITIDGFVLKNATINGCLKFERAILIEGTKLRIPIHPNRWWFHSMNIICSRATGWLTLEETVFTHICDKNLSKHCSLSNTSSRHVSHYVYTR